MNSMSSASCVRLVPFGVGNPLVTARGLRQAIGRARPTLGDDFPAVVRRYGSLFSSVKAVMSNARAVQQNTNYFAATIRCGNRIIGAVSAMLCNLPAGFDLQTGVLIAVWMVDSANGCNRRPHLLPELLDQCQHVLTRRGLGRHRVWTVVNVNNSHVHSCLTSTPAFDGFSCIGAPRVFSEIDGSTQVRRLYASNRCISER